jgi:hypothetical protein
LSTITPRRHGVKRANALRATEEKVKTSIYLPESLHWRLKETAVAMRLKDTEAMEEAVRRWVQQPRLQETAQESQETEPLSADDLMLAKKFLRWIRKPRKSRTDTKLVQFMMNEIESE